MKKDSRVFNVHLLPATYGDCIWVEYGDGRDMYRILIDGGTAGTRHRINEMVGALPEDQRHFELMVVTHIDRDHIAGLLGLLEEDTLSFTVGDFWFNGWHHLTPSKNVEAFGGKQGEYIATEILKHNLRWNHAFNGGPVLVDQAAGLPVIDLPGGMQLTLLSPTQKELTALKPKWLEEVVKAGLNPGFGVEQGEKKKRERFGTGLNIYALAAMPFKEDGGAANGSSIAFLATYADKTVLFAGDAFPSVITNSLNLLSPEKRVKIDLVKLSHHASEGNTSPDLLRKLDCKQFAISTNGAIYKHPTQVTVARVIKINGPQVGIYFNYETEYSKPWMNRSLQLLHRFKTYSSENGNLIIQLGR